jgi:tRNA A37 N6-isopentenylltransferase MiaA
MFLDGALEEVVALDASLQAQSTSCSVTFNKIHGLEESRKVISGEMTARDAVLAMATRSRQYAKRQDTWARRWPGMQSIAHEPSNPQQTVEQILYLIPKESGIPPMQLR